LSLKRIALITAIGLGLARAHTVQNQIRGLTTVSNFRWIYIAEEIVSFLFMLPFPILLVILYRSDTVLAVSKLLKRAALATAIVYGLLFTAPGVLGWVLALRRDLHEIQAFGRITVAGNFLAWLDETSQAGDRTWQTISVFAEVAFVLFLVALFLYRNESAEAGPRLSRPLRKAAALATIMGGLGTILNIGVQVYAATQFRKPEPFIDDLFTPGPRTLGQFIVKNALSMIPDECFLVAAFVVYRAQPQPLPDQASDA
jgi:hypothetical protein